MLRGTYNNAEKDSESLSDTLPPPKTTYRAREVKQIVRSFNRILSAVARHSGRHRSGRQNESRMFRLFATPIENASARTSLGGFRHRCTHEIEYSKLTPIGKMWVRAAVANSRQHGEQPARVADKSQLVQFLRQLNSNQKTNQSYRVFQITRLRNSSRKM